MRNATARAHQQDDLEGVSRRLSLVDDLDEQTTAVRGTNGRRTVKITGQPVPARRRRSTAATQIQTRPDRIALYAVLLGLFLVFMAVVTASAGA